MKRFVFFSLLAFLSCAAVAQQLEEKYALWENGVGKSRWFMYHLEPDDVLRLKDKWKSVEESIQSKPEEFAAPYYQPAFMSGYFLIWSERKGFVYVQYFDIEHPCYFSYGSAARVGDEIHFTIDYETTHSRCPGESVTPVRWIPAGNGDFFIPASEAKRFGEFYAGRGEFNGFFVKWREEGLPFPQRSVKHFTPKTTFVLPKTYQAFVRQPINAEITWRGKGRVQKYKPIFSPFWDKSSLTPVRINAGQRQGIRNGVEFILLDEHDADAQTLRITQVYRSTAIGIVVRRVDENGIEGFYAYDEKLDAYVTKPFNPVAVGTKVTTSPIPKLY